MVVLLGSAAACVIAALYVLAAEGLRLWPVALLLLALGAGLPLWLLRSTHYTLTDTELLVRAGPFRWRVPLHAVRAVTPTHNPLSSPALSLDRLRIDYTADADRASVRSGDALRSLERPTSPISRGRTRSIMISPREKEVFLRELERRRGAR